jgi:hypothetical protein
VGNAPVCLFFSRREKAIVDTVSDLGERSRNRFLESLIVT